MRKLILALLVLAVSPSLLWGADIVVTDDDIVGTVNWTNDNTYLLDGFVFVENGEVLNIQEGTIIKGKEVPDPATGDFASALIVARGGAINAIGTASQPIVFTTDADIVTDTTDLSQFDRGLWGGVILLGNATINTAAGEGFIEGLDPAQGYPGEYGDASLNFDDDHNAGTLQYVSIRHGGAELTTDEEINGLTLGAVGAGTTIDHIEVYANLDDGVEWFGGTVRIKYAAVAFCADDSYDYDEGFNGSGQYFFTIADNAGDHSGEHDGGTTPEDGLPYAIPRFSNVTYMGAGECSSSPKNPYCFLIRDNAGGKWYNSIFADHANAGIFLDDASLSTRLPAGDIVFENNYWFGYGDGNNWAAIAPQPAVATYLQGTGTNYLENPGIRGTSRVPSSQAMDPRPCNLDKGFVNVPDDTLSFFDDNVGYLGAFDPNADLWLRGWTTLDLYGFLIPQAGPGGTVTVTNADVQGSYTFFANTEYELDGFVFAECGEVIYIEPGTVIKGQEVPATSTDFASAMIVARGGRIYAMGTMSDPITFTTDADNVADTTDLNQFDRGLWGGVILLGNATINTAAGEGFIEGLDPAQGYPGEYGDASLNFDDDHDAGVLHYVSIRHGGAELTTDEEINGLTMGAVGAGTEVNYIEVYGNFDDGLEWFGGTVRIKHAVVAFCADDSYDYDEGFNGSGQYFFTIQDNAGDHAGEHDGGTTPEDGLPYAIPRFANVTYMGAGETSGSPKNPYCFLIRDNAGGKWYNSIFTDHANAGIFLDDASLTDRLPAGDIVFENNLWYAFGDVAGGDIWAEIAPQPAVATYLQGTGTNTIADPLLASISRSPSSGALDPTPDPAGPATGGIPIPDDTLNFFDDVPYKGAFDPNAKSDDWMKGWTTLDLYGFLGSGDCCDLAGDANNDAAVNVADAVYMINYIFKGGDAPPCANEGDANADCALNVADAVYLINYIFKGGEAPVCGCVE